MPFEPLLGGQELTQLLRETDVREDAADAAFDVWYDVRTTVEPTALVMWGDVAIGRSTLPREESNELRASAQDDLYGGGSLLMRAVDGLLVCEELLYAGIPEDEDDEDD